MNSSLWKDPTVLVIMGVIGLSLPALGILFQLYSASEQGIRNELVSRSLSPIPDTDALLKLVQSALLSPELSLELYYVPEKLRPSGLAAVYTVRTREARHAWLAVFRYDIACSVCRDVLGAALYGSADLSLRRVWFLTEPLGREGEPVDTKAFLAQFAGSPVKRRLALEGGNVDGISEATRSCEGLVWGLNETRKWLLENIGYTCCQQNGW